MCSNHKIDKIRQALAAYPKYRASNSASTTLDSLEPVSQDLILKLITKWKPTSCRIDPMPTSLVKDYAVVLAPLTTTV